ncbi:MAG: hypothetical protein COT00_02760 [Candidatus Omnitrophica bacterium CG07_land_8_20_14_0_80_50_8]|nr:MAG: hypothetical protein COT00_02760 [Candidatus Omnitrophica bacterium CG07_land_8_20_14_0_80_50_8]
MLARKTGSDVALGSPAKTAATTGTSATGILKIRTAWNISAPRRGLGLKITPATRGPIARPAPEFFFKTVGQRKPA